MAAYLLVNGVRTDPEAVNGGRYRFRLRLPVQEIRLISRTARPADLGTSTDIRQLGVELTAMRWACGDSLTDVPIDSPYLVDGFHHVERRPPRNQPVRWTTGDARLPPELVPAKQGDAILHLSIASWQRSSAASRLDPTVELLSEFESLGEDCEFGFVQQRCAVGTPVTLLRWSGTTLEDLIRGLDCRFQDLDTIANRDVVWDGKEYFLRTPFLSMHTGETAEQGIGGIVAIANYGRASLRILRRKLLRDIAEARRIFVFASQDPSFDDTAMRRLHAALRAIGPASLLCVKPAAPAGPGTLRVVASGLYAGTVGAFARQDAPLEDWLRLCAEVRILHRRDRSSRVPPRSAQLQHAAQ